ncbi:UNVERIFIED_CONTAM: hypothetical protein HDU68_006702, partial [Siphonaria sp. JEL0065]
MANSSGLIQNVVFRDAKLPPGGGNGAALRISGANVVISNTRFHNLTADNGGAIIIDASQVSLTNITFESNTAAAASSLGGGDMLIMGSSVVTCNECHSANPSTRSSGAFVLITQTSTLDMNGGSCYNGVANWAGCWMVDINSNVTLNNVSAANSHAVAGGVIFLNHASTVQATNLRIKDSYADGQGGCVYSYGGGVLILRDSFIDHCYCPTCFGGFAVMQANSELYIYGTTLQNIVAGSVAGVILGTNNAIVVVDQGSVIQNSVGGSDGGVFKNEQQSSFSILGGSRVSNCTSGGNGAFYYGDSGGKLSVNNTTILGNYATLNGGAIFAFGDESVTISNSRIHGNKAHDGGGAIFGKRGAKITLNGTISITENAAAHGGAISVTSATVTLLGTDIVIQNNYAETGSLADILSETDGYLLRPQATASIMISGSIFIQYTATALEFKSLGQFNLPGVSLFGMAATLGISNSTLKVDSVTSIQFGSKIPDFSVYAQDPFGNPVNVSFANPVIVKVEEMTGQGVTLEGESIKAIVDNTTNVVQFTGLRINRPGNFTLRIKALFGLNKADSIQWPSFPITVAVCDPDTQMLFTANNLCVPINNTSKIKRVGVAIAAAIGIIFLILNLLGLQKYQTLKLIRSN